MVAKTRLGPGGYPIPNVHQSISLSVSFGSFSETGIASTFGIGFLNFSGSFLENSPNNSFGLDKFSNKGIFNLTGIDDSFGIGFNSSTGLFLLTGQELIKTLTMPLEEGTFVLTGSGELIRFFTMKLGTSSQGKELHINTNFHSLKTIYLSSILKNKV